MIQERNKKNSAKNKYPHYMGQKGYGRSIPDWKKDGRLPAEFFSSGQSTSADSDVCEENVGTRALPWVLAHQKRSQDGTWAVPASRPDAVQAAERIVSVLLI